MKCFEKKKKIVGQGRNIILITVEFGSPENLGKYITLIQFRNILGTTYTRYMQEIDPLGSGLILNS